MAEGSPSITVRRVAGVVLLVLAALPLYALLADRTTGPAGLATLNMAREYSAFVWSGFALVCALALIAARLVRYEQVERAAMHGAWALLAPSLPLFTLFSAAIAALLAWYINQHVLYGEPTLIDAMSQLIHARYLAAGELAGPRLAEAAFWQTPHMLMTANGWVSQYPPGHAVLLAAGLRLGVPELVGPVVLGATVAVTCLLAHRILPPATARFGTLLLALSPFAAAQAAAYMNHATAALFAACAVYGAVRARQDASIAGGVITGVSLSLLLATRPLTAVVVGVLALLVLTGMLDRERGAVRWAPVLATALAAVPITALLFAYNAHFFGSPVRFGYTVALGPDGGLGFGFDPWGNRYGFMAALGYTSAELAALNLFLLETPLPVIALTGLWLILVPRSDVGTRIAALWALLPLAAHLLYWHHGLYMGPRMLADYAPAWSLTVACALVGLYRAAPAVLERAPSWSPRAFVATALAAAALYAASAGVPGRINSYRTPVLPLGELARAAPEEALVFVHGTWPSRLAMQLSAAGMRSDSLETLMRRNSTCTVQRWVDAGRRGIALELERAFPNSLPTRRLPSGTVIRIQDGERWAPACARQVAADRWGVTEVAPYLWRAGLPGIGGGALLARDLGPAANARLIEDTGAVPWMLRLDQKAGRVQLVPYAAAMRAIWGDSAAPAEGGTVAPQ